MQDREIKRKIIDVYQKDPVVLVKSLFDIHLWSKQEEVLHSIWNNKRTAVKSGNTVGKSFTSALAAISFLIAHKPSKVITTAPTFLQVEEILWKEIAKMKQICKMAL